MIISKKVQAFDNKLWSVEMFDTPLELVSVCANREVTHPGFEQMRSEGGIYNKKADWLGVHSWEEAMDLMTYGYNPMVKEFESITPELTGIGKRVAFKNSVEGFAPIVPLALMGVPNSMVAVRMKPIKTKVIDVYYINTCAWWGTTAQITRAGKQVLKALLTLELSGYKFNLYTMQTYAESRANGEAVMVKVKSSNQPLDLRKMSFTLAHPAAFRVVSFDWISRFPKGTYRSHYGTALSFTYSQEEIDRGLNEITGKPCVVLDMQELINKAKAGNNDDEVVKYIKDRLTGGKNNGR